MFWEKTEASIELSIDAPEGVSQGVAQSLWVAPESSDPGGGSPASLDPVQAKRAIDQIIDKRTMDSFYPQEKR
jgi:hypothetical protein